MPEPVYYPGENAWLHIEYAGDAPGIKMWPGPFTGFRYPFGKDRTHGKVDMRDGARFLTQRVADGADRAWRPYKANSDGSNAYFAQTVADSIELDPIQAVEKVSE